jgi:FixJ family two-component response regulator
MRNRDDWVVYLIDPDPAVRDAIALALHMHDFEVTSFASGDELLTAPDLHRAGCVVIEASTGTMPALELLAHLRERSIRWPVIVIGTGASLNAVSVQAGAFCFLHKPFTALALMRCLEAAEKSMPNGDQPSS